MATKYPGGSRFEPTELGLVKRYLKNKVEKNDSDSIKTLNVYGDAPWLLHHDTNPLYARNEWYYFVPRTVRGVKTVSRMVPGNGESFLGGTWKSVGKRKEIKKNKELKGYKRVLVFNKNVAGKLEKEKTDWHMDEYSLHKNGDEFHDLVLCHVRLLNSAERFKPLVPPAHQLDENNDNHVLPNQDQQEAGYAMQEYEGGDVNQHQQQQEEEQEDSRIPLQSNYNQGQYLLEANVYQNDMMMLENDRGYLNQHQQQQQQQEQEYSPIYPHPINNNLEPCPFDDLGYHGAEDDMTGYGLMPTFNDANQQHEQQQDSSTLLPPPFQSNYNQRQYLLEDIVSQKDRGYLNQHQQQQQQQYQEDSRIFPHPPSEINYNLDPFMCADLAYITTGYELMPSFNEGNDVNQQHEQQQDSPPTLQTNDNQEHHPFEDYAFDGADDNSTFDVDELLNSLDEWKEQQQDQEQLQKDLQSFLFDHSWDDDFGFDGAAEDDWNMQNMDEGMKQKLQELEEDLSKLLQPVPQPQDSGVHADQVMPKD